jgi:EAL domain-containing protein (putative c-di-GMP-specific phosphodiesterase class I)
MTSASRGRVLIVDDERDLLELLTELLGGAGYEVVTATQGQEALDALGQGRFDVVLSDIVMPNLDGLQLLRAIRERDLDVPVVLMTGSPRVETAAQAVEHGALRYLVKPIAQDELLAVVQRATRLHSIARLKREVLVHLGADGHLVGDQAGLEASFPAALEAFWMAYQPIVRAADGRLFGHEALLRSDDPRFPSPVALFGAAERLGRVAELGRAVRARIAKREDEEENRGMVFVNVHPGELADDHLLHPAAPLSRLASGVALEITERAGLDGIPNLRGRVAALRRLGYWIGVDDLGAGYAGLTSFATLEPDIVKLDMALVREAHREPVKRRLIGSICGLCHELGILVVAEGIESEEERRVAVAEGCDLLQGYLIGRPSGRPR